MAKAWGILGGSFDPIHNGHLLLARDVYRELGLEKIFFIPAYIAPHKIGQSYATAADRLEMTRRAVTGDASFEVLDLEIRRGDVSYTYDTVVALKSLYPERDFYFIIGADSVSQLHTWHRIGELMQLVRFAVVYRPGYDEDICRARELYGDLALGITLVHAAEYDVSSTVVRQRVASGLSISAMVPVKVEEYIQSNGLYRQH